MAYSTSIGAQTLLVLPPPSLLETLSCQRERSLTIYLVAIGEYPRSCQSRSLIDGFLVMSENEREALKRRIRTRRRALKYHPTGDPHCPHALSKLVIAIEERYDRDDSCNDLEGRIKLRTEILDLRPPGLPERSASLSTLVNALSDLYHLHDPQGDRVNITLSEWTRVSICSLSLYYPGLSRQYRSLMRQAIPILQTPNRSSQIPFRLFHLLLHLRFFHHLL